jgi:FixJ family two-component response regulator
MSIRQNSRLIAIVDDNESVQCALRDLLESEGLATLCFGSAEEFLNSGAHYKAASLIADIRLPGISGLELQAKLKAERCSIPIILITALDDAGMRAFALRNGAVELLTKPFDDAVLLKTVHVTLETAAPAEVSNEDREASPWRNAQGVKGVKDEGSSS